MRPIPKREVRKIARELGIDLSVGGIDYWQRAATTELAEHGHWFDNDPMVGMMIASDHIAEFPDYYDHLATMEGALRKKSTRHV